MGYTVNIVANLKLLRENFADIAQDAREFIEQWERETGEKVKGPAGTGEPVINNSERERIIAFNGDGERGTSYETFSLEASESKRVKPYAVLDIETLYSLDEDTFYEFFHGREEAPFLRLIENGIAFYTKTGKMPYDTVVKSVALAVRKRLGEQAHVSCDGTLLDWKRALDLVQKVKGWDMTDDLYRDISSFFSPCGVTLFFNRYNTYKDYRGHASYILGRLEENKQIYAELKKLKDRRKRKGRLLRNRVSP